jgi:hypothetical protein
MTTTSESTEELTSLGVSEVTLWEPSEVEIETLVDVSDVLLEMFSDLWELSNQ